MWGRLLAGIAIVGLAVYYQYYQGMVQGQNDAAFAEIMYDRQESGRTVTEDDRGTTSCSLLEGELSTIKIV